MSGLVKPRIMCWPASKARKIWTSSRATGLNALAVSLEMPIHRQQYGNTLNTDRKRALHDIAACRTPFFGGHVYQCDHCREKVFSYHSCRNRSCPKCHQDQTEGWLSH